MVKKKKNDKHVHSKEKFLRPKTTIPPTTWPAVA